MNSFLKIILYEKHMQSGLIQAEIMHYGNTATLTTPNGAINGRFVSQTPEFPGGVWYFQAMVPNFMNQPNLGAKFEVVIVKRSANVLSGGTTVKPIWETICLAAHGFQWAWKAGVLMPHAHSNQDNGLHDL